MSLPGFYPQASSLINLGDLPEELSFLQEGLDTLLDNVFLKNIQVIKSESGDAASYVLTLKIYQRLGVDIPGTGLSVLLNPPSQNDPEPDSSEIELRFAYSWEILKWLSNFSIDSFSGSGSALLDTIIEIYDIYDEQLLDYAVKEFALNNINLFVDQVNDFYSLTGPDAIPYPSGSTRDEMLTALADSINDSSLAEVSVVVYGVYIAIDPSLAFQKIDVLFQSLTAGINVTDVFKKLIIPDIQAILVLTPAIDIPRSVLTPVNEEGEVEENPEIKTRLIFDIGEFSYSTGNSLGFPDQISISFDPEYPTAQIGQTGLSIGFQNAKLDLSRTSSLPEITAAGYPDDFVGVFIEEAEIGLPKFWQQDDANSTAIIKGKNLIIGTGGISGVIGMEAKTGSTDAPLIKANLGSFQVYLMAFDITFKQNAIIASSITGKLIVPGFKDSTGEDAEIDIKVNIGTGGDFQITASEEDGIPLVLQNVLTYNAKSLAFGRSDDKFFLQTSGSIEFDEQGAVGKFIKDPIELEKLRIWEDGSIELQGGTIPLPKNATLKLGPANITITALHFGSHEQMHDGKLRKYRYFGFDGGLSVKPGGIDARGDGIKFYFTVDNGPLHVFFRIQSIAVDLVIPGSASKESAAVLISGYLAMKDPPPGSEGGTEYIGGISFALPKVKLAGSAGMRMNPKVPAFLIDISLELPVPIPLGTTGLGIYGFRGLLGQRYVAEKQSVGLRDDDSWYQYYKKKVSPDFREGIQVSKFTQKQGFSVGAGISLATATDSGKTFSSKIFFLLSLPEVFLLQGQAAILKQRIGLDSTQDPPFSAMIAISSKSVETAFGVNYKLPDPDGAILKLDALIEMGFFFGSASSWYINVGRDLPQEKRVQARILSLFSAYSYLMLSSQGIKAGAGLSFELNKNFGPVGIEIKSYMDMYGRLSFQPVQIGGGISMGGSIRARFLCFRFGFSIAAALAAEANKPFIITGSLEISFTVPGFGFRKKSRTRSVRIELTWFFNRDLDLTPNELLNAAYGAKAVNMMSFDSFPIWGSSSTGSGWPALPPSLDQQYIIPLDSFIDFEFLRPVGTGELSSHNRFYTPPGGSLNVELVPPIKGKSDQVWHNYRVKTIEIYARNTGGTWEFYDPYKALTPMSDLGQVNFDSLLHGYWQLTEPGKINKLRILADNPLSYMRQAGAVDTDELGFKSGFITCAGETKQKTCVSAEGLNLSVFEQDRNLYSKGVVFRMLDKNGILVTTANDFGKTKGLLIPSGGSLEIYFANAVAVADLKLYAFSPNTTITYYQREQTGLTPTGLPAFEFTSLGTFNYSDIATYGKIHYEDGEFPIDKIYIEGIGTCDPEDLLAQESDHADLITTEDLNGFLLEDGNDCRTVFFEVCYLTKYDYIYNRNIPSQSKVTQQNQAMVNAISRTITPIWRPDTTYAIRIQTSDRVEAGKTRNENDKYHTFYFKTAGPIGHFHQFSPEYNALKQQGLEDQFKLATLKDYIDYTKSYPNADGNLINAKPLFYVDPVLLLFYKYSYVYTMYNDFTGYNNLPNSTSSLDILIKDPAEPTSGDVDNPIIVTPSEKTWKKNEWPIISSDIRLLNNHFQEGAANCSATEQFIPVSINSEITPLELKPEKLYTAILRARYKGNQISEIHKYVFQTSRYATFGEQIDSYMLKDIKGNFLRNAIYYMVETYDDNQLNEMYELFNGTLNNDSLTLNYSDKFDRLFDGILKFGTLAPPVTTEFNVIRDFPSSNTIGILIRTPEPFNDPKIPEEILADTIQLQIDGDNNETYKVIFSKDRSKAFISNSSQALVRGQATFTFTYKKYNGKDYVIADTKTISWYLEA